ncbi:MAG: flippase-like domain-containing protein, partial [Actinobacteria bacterium]
MPTTAAPPLSPPLRSSGNVGSSVHELPELAWSAAEAVGARLAGVSPLLLAAGLVLHLLKLAARARAWQNVLRAALPVTPVRFGDAAVPYLAGIGTGALVPFGGGQVLRVALGHASTATILGSLTVERALDAAVSAVVLGIALTVGLLPNVPVEARLASLAALFAHPMVVGLAGGAIGLVAVGAWRYRRPLDAPCTRVLRGLRVLGQPRYLASVASWQLLAWALRFGALVLLLEAFHVRSAVAAAPIVLSLQLLAGSVPVTPAGVGRQQALVAAAFGGGAILAFSVGAQAATTVVDLLLGSIALGC